MTVEEIINMATNMTAEERAALQRAIEQEQWWREWHDTLERRKKETAEAAKKSEEEKA